MERQVVILGRLVVEPDPCYPLAVGTEDMEVLVQVT
jgi:hypothetical protein